MRRYGPTLLTVIAILALSSALKRWERRRPATGGLRTLRPVVPGAVMELWIDGERVTDPDEFLRVMDKKTPFHRTPGEQEADRAVKDFKQALLEGGHAPDPFADIDAMSERAEQYLRDEATLLMDETGDAVYDVTDLDLTEEPIIEPDRRLPRQ